METYAVLVLAAVLTTAWEVIEWLLELPLTVFHGYSWLVRSAADSVRSLYDSYGYWVIFLGTLCENTLFLGLVIPGVLVILLAGLSAENGSISVPLALAFGIGGTVLGDTISYAMGRFGWRRFGTGQTVRELEERVREPLLRRGALFVLVYHFFGYTRLIGPAAAGFLKMPYRRWAPADHAGASLWVSVYLAIGYGLGALGLTLDSTDRWFRVVEWGLLVFVLILGYQGYRMGQRALRPFDAAQARQAQGKPGQAQAAEEEEPAGAGVE